MNEHDDALRAAYATNARLRQRWYEALEDGERFREEAQAARDLIRSLRRELDATKRAKAENDERFQLEAARAREEARKLRAERDAALRAVGDAYAAVVTADDITADTFREGGNGGQ